MKIKTSIFAAVTLMAGITAPAYAVTLGATGADFTTLANALTAVNGLPAGDPGRFIDIIDDGTYGTAGNIAISDIRITGTGAARPVINGRFTISGASPVILENLIIRVNQPDPMTQVFTQAAVTLQATTTGTGYQFTNVLIDGTPSGPGGVPRYGGDGILANTAGTFALTNVEIRSAGRDGIRWGGAATINANGLSVSNSVAAGLVLNTAGSVLAGSNVTLDGNTTVGLQLAGAGASINLAGLTIRNSGSDGFLASQTGTTELTNPLIELNGRDGIRLNNPSNQLTLVGGELRNNIARGLLYNNTASGTVTNTAFTGNGTDGIAITSGPSTLDAIGISSTGNGQAGVRINANSTVSITNNSVISGNGTSGSFSGIQLAADADGSSLTVSNATIANNTNHGVQLNRNGIFQISNSSITGNGTHGVIRDFELAGSLITTTLTVEDNTIANNALAGVIILPYSQQVTANINRNTFSGNGYRPISTEASNPDLAARTVLTAHRNTIADGSNGAHYGAFIGYLLPGSTFINNLVDQGLGGIAIANSDVAVQHNTIVGDSAGSAVGIDIIAAPTQNVDIRNNIVANVATGIALSGTATGLLVDYNLTSVSGTDIVNIPSAGANNITGNPLFISASNTVGAGNYSLQGTSPAIDAGVGVGVVIDLVGTARPIGTAPDIGAYEVEATTSVIDWIMQ